MRHCGSLLSHEQSHNPDKERSERGEEVNDREEEGGESLALSGTLPPR